MNSAREALDKDFFKEKLIKLGCYKHPDGRQLYELEIDKLQELYEQEKANLHKK